MDFPFFRFYIEPGTKEEVPMKMEKTQIRAVDRSGENEMAQSVQKEKTNPLFTILSLFLIPLLLVLSLPVYLKFLNE